MGNTYIVISIISFSVSIIFLLLSIIMWFKFDIWKVIGDLSGRRAKKTIANMRVNNEKNGVNIYDTPTKNSETNQCVTEVLARNTEKLSYNDTNGYFEIIHIIQDITIINTDEII